MRVFTLGALCAGVILNAGCSNEVVSPGSSVAEHAAFSGTHPYEGGYVHRHRGSDSFLTLTINRVAGGRVAGCYAYSLRKDKESDPLTSEDCFDDGVLVDDTVTYPFYFKGQRYDERMMFDAGEGGLRLYSSFIEELGGRPLRDMSRLSDTSIVASIRPETPSESEPDEGYPFRMLTGRADEYLPGHELVGGYFVRPSHNAGGWVALRIEQVSANGTVSGEYAGYLVDPRTHQMLLTEFDFVGTLNDAGNVVTFEHDSIEYRFGRYGNAFVSFELAIGGRSFPGGNLKLAKHVNPNEAG